jgi:hypothetical protein
VQKKKEQYNLSNLHLKCEIFIPLSGGIPISLVPSFLPRKSRLRLRKGSKLSFRITDSGPLSNPTRSNFLKGNYLGFVSFIYEISIESLSPSPQHQETQ